MPKKSIAAKINEKQQKRDKILKNIEKEKAEIAQLEQDISNLNALRIQGLLNAYNIPFNKLEEILKSGIGEKSE